MGFSRHSRRKAERRKRFWAGVVKLSILLGAMGAVAYNAYKFGVELKRDEIAGLETRLERISDEKRSLEAEAARMTEALGAARAEAADYRDRYRAVVPSPQMRELVDMVRAKLDDGLSAQRLALYIRAARAPRDCSPTETKRFLVRTPIYDGANTWVRFQDLVTVTASGESAVAADGRPHAWFDPEQPVTVSFQVLGGGEAEQITGRLPLHHSVVVKDREFRFSIAPGKRGFLEVAGDACAFDLEQDGGVAQTH